MRLIFVLVLALSAAACASSGAIPQPFPVPGGASAPQPVPEPSPSPAAEPSSQDGYALAGTALSFRGLHYRSGGSSPASGFDCSGLVWYVFAQHGLQVPRTVAEQYRVGSNVESRDLRAGDLVFFNTTGSGASHVGILIGGDEFVHAPNAAGEVRVERLGATYWADRFVGARRIP